MQVLMHPDQQPPHTGGKRPDDGAEPRPTIWVHVVEPVPDPAQPVVLHGSGVHGIAELAAGWKRQANLHVRLGRAPSGRGSRGGSHSTDSAAGAVKGKDGGHEVLGFNRTPLQWPADRLGLAGPETGEIDPLGLIM